MHNITDKQIARLETEAQKALVLRVPADEVRGLLSLLHKREAERDEALVASCGLDRLVERALERAKLTAKEREVARLILKGLSNKEIASVTGNTDKTIKHHVAMVFRKFKVFSRTEFFHDVFPT